MIPGASGFVIAAPHSGSGKTVVTLGLLRALSRSGRRVRSAKVGPDYIDPRFHAAASGADCVNLDPWAMREPLLRALLTRHGALADLLVVEGVMGLYDGAADGTGSTADLATMLDLPVVLVIDASKQAQSIAALVRGFRDHGRADVAAVILNRVGSERHARMLQGALDAIGMPVIGMIPRDATLALPERHLGLVQAVEHGNLESFLERAADIVARSLDLDALRTLAKPPVAVPLQDGHALSPLGQRTAIACDSAFAFAYPHMLQGWIEQGAELSFFSPLADEAPRPDADAVYLPGGYPELHAGRLASAANFLGGLRSMALRNILVYGECGGYMVLGDGLVDASGVRHAMAGLLPLETSFEEARLHLGYRNLIPRAGKPWPPRLAAHEFHYARVLREDGAAPLFDVSDAEGTPRPAMGLIRGSVMGSFAHVIDQR